MSALVQLRRKQYNLATTFSRGLVLISRHALERKTNCTLGSHYMLLLTPIHLPIPRVICPLRTGQCVYTAVAGYYSLLVLLRMYVINILVSCSAAMLNRPDGHRGRVNRTHTYTHTRTHERAYTHTHTHIHSLSLTDANNFKI